MWKKIESIILHFVIVFVRRGFKYLLERCGVVLDDSGSSCWYNERCGLMECIYDEDILELIYDGISDSLLWHIAELEKQEKELESYAKPFGPNS